jgi:hypothetical protein
MTLIALGLAWLAGIALAGWLEPPLPVLGLLALPALAGLLLWHKEARPRLAALCTLALLAGGARLLVAMPHFGPDNLAYYNDQGRVELIGVVVDEPDVRDTYQNLRLRAESLTIDPVGVGLAPTPDAGAGARPAPTEEERPILALLAGHSRKE